MTRDDVEKTGPMTREQQVRDTLPNRLAGIEWKISHRARQVFGGLCVCGRSEGPISPSGRPFLGKSEAEWHWPEAHEELREAGLIEFRTEERAAPGSVTGRTTYLIWNMTRKGLDVMDDTRAWRRQMREARDADEAELGPRAA